jgi:NAD(P)-dependent dehydrogenase (short-subunit alcohol dehydrogenase family)
MLPRAAIYSSTKAGVVHFTRCIAQVCHSGCCHVYDCSTTRPDTEENTEIHLFRSEIFTSCCSIHKIFSS